MKYYTYVQPGKDDQPEEFTFSEQDIIRTYYPYWREQMIKKFGQEQFERNWCQSDCIDDWIVINWAWESQP